MPREISIERAVCREAKRLGMEPIKVGVEGWPDRQVLIGKSRHIWIEFKQPGEKLRPAQRRRIDWLRARGDVVYLVNEVEYGLRVLQVHSACGLSVVVPP